MDAVGFAEIARSLGAAAVASGLHVPAFRSPPKEPAATRTVTHLPGGVVVAVRLRDRPDQDVIDDMILGLLLANHKDATHPATAVLQMAAAR